MSDPLGLTRLSQGGIAKPPGAGPGAQAHAGDQGPDPGPRQACAGAGLQGLTPTIERVGALGQGVHGIDL